MIFTDAIVYTSESGFTKKYAELLSKKTELPAYELNNAGVSEGAEVIYMGWLMAGSVKGYKKAAKRFDVKAVCAVGMAAPGTQTPESIKKQNGITGIPVFYLQGGFNISKLHGIHKFMMKMMIKTVGKKLENKPDKTQEESETLAMFKNGGDYVSDDNLSQVFVWYNDAQSV